MQVEGSPLPACQLILKLTSAFLSRSSVLLSARVEVASTGGGGGFCPVVEIPEDTEAPISLI